ncbi:hypothetical protein KI811_05355 [Geobacter hydrogenophilus]|nr:hypothetical protein [Geobacter hydrogenophilus]
MTQTKRNISFLLPSIADIIFITLLLYLSFPSGKGLLNDGDTGYHIRAGEYILNRFSIPRYDMFSFLSPPLPWTAHEWLSEIIMALLHRGFGLTGAVIFFASLIAFTYYLFFKLIMRSAGNNILLSALVSLVAISASTIHWLARPHIFSLLLIILWYFILDSFQYRNRNWLFFLPLLMLLWVNLHGGYVIGFVMTGIYFVGNLTNALWGQSDEKQQSLANAKKLAISIALCLIASLINPFGVHILLFPFNLVSNKYIMDHVMEFLSPNFHDLSIFKYLLLAMIAVFAVSREKLNLTQLLLVLLFTNMALYSVRYIPLFAIITAPILLRRVDQIMTDSDNGLLAILRERSTNIAKLDASNRGFLWPALAMMLVIFLAASGKIEFRFDEKKKPVAAVEFLKKEKIAGNMLNNDEFGDYIIYAAWPQYKVFFDGRSDMYGTERMKEYNTVVGFDTGWDDVVSKYRFTWVIFDTDSILSRILLQKKDWKLIYSDKVANIFVRDLPQYQYLIEKYKNVKPVVVNRKEDT